MNGLEATEVGKPSRWYVVGNIVLAIVLAVMFLAVCMYFSTAIDSSLELSQEAAADVGGINMMRIVIIFGSLTALYSAVSYKISWLKLSVLLLLACWVLGTILVGLILFL